MTRRRGKADVVAPHDVVGLLLSREAQMGQVSMKKENNQEKVESSSTDGTYNIDVIGLSVEMSYYTF